MAGSGYREAMLKDDPALDGAALVAWYERGAAELRAAAEGFSPAQARERPVPGRWSAIELVAHVADVEVYFTDRIVRTVALDHPLLLAVDEQNYPARLRYQEFDLEEQLTLVAALRRHAARMLRLQPAEAWKRTGVHSHNGVMTLRQIVLYAARHLQHHLPFLLEKRAALLPPAGG